MKKVLIAEAAVLLLLLIAAVFVRLGISDASAQLGGTSQDGTQASTGATEDTPVLGPGFSEPQPSETEATEPSQEPTQITLPQELVLQARQYFIYDIDTDEFLLCAGTVEDQIYPASITKLFTAYVALQHLELTEVITAKDALEGVSPDSSLALIDWGDKLTVDMLIEAMLLPSGNDAAHVLAVETGRRLEGNAQLHHSDAVIAFAEEMNRQAQALGMTGTHFVTPDGIHKENHYTCYQDLVTMAKLALENDTIMKYASTRVDIVNFVSGEERIWDNTNALINPNSPYYCPYAIGLKTGRTNAAGSCLLSAFRYEDRTLVIGVFGCTDNSERFVDTLKLFDLVADPAE